MKHERWISIGIALIWAMAMTPGAAAEDETTVKGEVIQVHQRVRTQNGGEFDELTIRTRQGEEMRLRLGASGECDGCFQEGDHVRARLMQGEPADGAHAVREMKVRQTGQTYQFRNESGELTQARHRHGADRGQGDCLRTRSEDGSGQQAGGGQRHGSGAGGGGSRGSGRGGDR